MPSKIDAEDALDPSSASFNTPPAAQVCGLCLLEQPTALYRKPSARDSTGPKTHSTSAGETVQLKRN